ncbi:MAG: LAGLIDADG endonuclease [Patescibacteria group bacterium]
MSLSNLQQQVLIGTLLGDGHLERSGKFVRLKIDHSEKQSEYVWWKYQIFKNFVPSPPRYIQVFDQRYDKVYQHCRFATKSLQILENFYNLFYLRQKKVLPKKITQLLSTPQSLAVWYMDDGARRTDCNALRLHTNSFTMPEQKVLQEVLLKNFKIKTKIHKAGAKTHVLYIPASQAQAFCNLVSPFMLPSLKGKLL